MQQVSVPEWTLTVEQDTSASVATACSPILVSIHQVLEEIHSSNAVIYLATVSLIPRLDGKLGGAWELG